MLYELELYNWSCLYLLFVLDVRCLPD